MKKPTPIYLLILLAFVLLSIYSLSFFNTYDAISTKFKISENNRDFLESSNSLLANLKDAESGQRGYLISNEEAYLVPYNDAIYRLSLEKERFFKICENYKLTVKNEKSLKELSALINQKTKEMEQTIIFAKANNKTAAVEIIKSDVGINYMNKIENILRKLYAEQYYKETTTMQSLMTERTNFKLLSVMMTLASFLLFSIIGLYVWYHSVKTSRLAQMQEDLKARSLKEINGFNMQKTNDVSSTIIY